MTRMLRNVVKCVMVLASSAVVIPYTISLLCNVLNGWPQTRHKFRRAFHPKKVYALNYAVLQKLVVTLRYFPRYIQWKMFYSSADISKIRKNFVFGRNNRNLDLYLPGMRGLQPARPHPVLVFVYGGAWSSGDKNMYGLVCSELANRLQVLVCCPNYSIYPQGYVDDMVQDVVDCVSWAYQNIEMYGGDKDRIMLVGHSAGAHLCMMAVLELLHDELIQGGTTQSQLMLQESLRFQDTHFDGKRSRIDTLDESSGSSGSFCVLNDNGEKGITLESSGATSMYEMISVKSDQGENGESSEQGSVDTGSQSKDDDDREEAPDSQGGAMDRQVSQDTSEVTEVRVEVTEVSGEEITEVSEEEVTEVSSKEVTEVTEVVRGAREQMEEEEEHSENESIVTIRPRELDRHPTLLEMGKSIKAVVGLAGVYDISDHFQHEFMRGVEDVSKMARAMYGNEHFDRFSPSSLVRTLSSSVSLPPVILIHGTEDYVVPLSSTTKLAEAIKEIYGEVTVRIIPGCDHFSVCLDIMNSKSKYYESVLGVILETAAKVLK